MMSYISRIDQEARSGSGATHGWIVRPPKMGKKFFNDRKYGGPEQALNAAIEYRDSIIQAPHEARCLPKENSAGIKQDVHEDGTIRGYVAYANLTPRTQTFVNFPVRKHGRHAKSRAVQCRKLMERIIDLSQGLVTQEQHHAPS